MKFSRYLIVGTLYLLVLSGCNAGPVGNSQPTATPVVAQVPGSDEKPPHETPGETPAKPEATLGPGDYTDAQGLPFPVPSTEANPIVILERKEAWGATLSVKEIPTLVDGDKLFILRAISEDGKTLAGVVVPRTHATYDPVRHVLMDVDSRQITDIAGWPQENRSISLLSGQIIAIDGEWVVWQDGSTLRVYNMTTKNYSEIEMARDSWMGVPRSHIPPTGVVSVDHGIIVWAEQTSEKPEGAKVASVIKSAELATGSVSIIGKHGVNPAISWPNVVWIEPDVTTEVEGQMLSRRVTLNLQTSAMTVSDRLEGLVEVAASADAVAWRAWNMSGTIQLGNFQDTRRQVVSPHDNSSVWGLTLNDRLVAWSNPYAPRVWDRQLQRLVKLDGYTGNLGTTIVNGSTLAWQAAPSFDSWHSSQVTGKFPNDMTIYIIDTSQLP